MNLVSIIKKALVLWAVILLNSVGFAGHSAAASAIMPHAMSGTSHSSANSAPCATLCRTAAVSKKMTTKL